ncbi:MAG: hypothetical protein DRP12_01560 [Candidatus Aenigmatarchaeota archaeon]|nr:MAG: hypothetical protein DRP12_01560 [Candidatus Aenigmarchaeota archaeon]
MVRGQLEIFAIIGLVVIGIVAVYYLFLSAPSAIPSESPAVPERLKHVQSWILNLLQEKLSENLRTLERQGGYFYPAADSPVYAGSPVAYWANCSSTVYPELQEIESLLKEKTLADVLDEINETMEIDNKQVVFQKNDAKLELSIKDDRIVYALWLPTRVEGEELAQPYAGSIPTRFGYIYKFARDFADFQASTRALEWATIRNIYYSELPTFGWLAGCGNFIHLTYQEATDLLTGVVKHTLSNILWWREPSGNSQVAPIAYIESVNNNRYEDLLPQLHLPDNYKVETSEIFLGPTEPVLETPPPLSIISFVCIQWYSVNYTFSFPAIVSVFDELTKNWLNFAVLVSVDRMRPSVERCGISISAGGLCENPQHPISLKIIDGVGNAIENAIVNYEGCILRSDQNGNVTGNVSAERGILQVFKEGYSVYRAEKSVDELRDLQITLYKPLKVNFKLYSGTCNNPLNHEIVFLYAKPISGAMASSFALNNSNLITCSVEDRDCWCSVARNRVTNQVSIDRILPGRYNVTAIIYNKNAISRYCEDPTEKDFPVYYRVMPVVTQEYEITIPSGFDEITVKLLIPDTDWMYKRAERMKEDEYEDYYYEHCYGTCLLPDKEDECEECKETATKIGIAQATTALQWCRYAKMDMLEISERCTSKSAQEGILKSCQESLQRCGSWWVKRTPMGLQPCSILDIPTGQCEICNETCLAYKGCFNESNNFAILDICINETSYDKLMKCVNGFAECGYWERERSWQPGEPLLCLSIPRSDPNCFEITGCFDIVQKPVCVVRKC